MIAPLLKQGAISRHDDLTVRVAHHLLIKAGGHVVHEYQLADRPLHAIALA